MINLKDSDIKIVIDICNQTPFKLNEELKYKFYNIDPSFDLIDDIKINYSIIRKKLNNDSNIPLYFSVGLSNKSFCNNLLIKNNNLDKIKKKYSEIIFFLFNDGTEIHRLFVKKNKEMLPLITDEYIINDIMKKIIASHYNKIIKRINDELKYNEIDFIGVSFSGGIGVFLSQMNTININTLILIAPAINEGFKKINKNQNIILGWCIQDIKVPYKTIGIKLIKELQDFNNKIIVLTDLGNETNDDVTHKIQDGIFDIITV